MASFATLSSLYDVVNLGFLLVFCIFLLSGSLRRHRMVTTKGILICCAVAGITEFSVGLWDCVAVNHGMESLAWLVHFERGLVWICFTLALHFCGSKRFRIMISLWWISLFVLVSFSNVMEAVRSRSVRVLEALTWPLHFVLFFCAMRDFACSGFFSRMTYSWINPLLRLGYTKPLTLEDIPSLVSEDEADLAYQRFAQVYDSLRGGKSSSCGSNLVFQAVIRVYFKENVLIGILALLRTISVVVSPLLLYAFVEYANREEENLYHGIAILGCLILAKVVESLTQRHWFFNSRRCGLRLRSALMVAVYQKILKLSSLGKRNHSTGEMINYIAVDAYRMGESSWWFHSMWSFILQLFLAIGVLFSVVGLGALPGLLPLLICALLNIPFARMIQNCQSRFMNAQDERLRATSEILNAMKVVKLHSWEEKFKSMIETRRAKEFKWLSELQIKKSCGTILYWISPTMISSVVFLGCEFFGSAPMNAATIFTVLATLRSMSEPARVIPEALSVMIQVKVSLDRINAFLYADELQTDEVRTIPLHNLDSIVEIQSGNFSWDPETKIPTLIDVNLDVKLGQKVAICGPVGAGKSSFLCSILGEIPKISGTVKVFGNIAYVSQSSWIQSGTIRDNILFGKPMDKGRYDKAVNACALDKDITSFDCGDLTEIGQRGLNLSGGQKQRIQLARAVYNDADIYLLDDPFSAVDAHTAAILFNDCVMDALQEKTVILVTHQVEFLSNVDKILVMDGGQITKSGSYEELLMAGTAFEQLISAHMEVVTRFVPSNYNELQLESQKIGLVHSEKPQGLNDIEQSSETEILEKGQPGVQLTQDEEMGIDSAGWRPFLDYIHVSKGSSLLCLCVMSFAAFVTLQAAATYWLAIAIEVPSVSTISLVGIYTGISMASVVFSYLRTFFAAHLGLKASKAFFGGFTDAIFRAPMLFFDSTPVGRILTRASSDLSILDYDIPFAVGFVASCYIEVAAIIVVMASVTWQVLIVGILAMVATKYVQGYYIASATELIRISGTTKAPVMNYAAETSQGVMAVRAFNMTDSFFSNYVQLVDTDATLCFASNASAEWLLMRIEALQSLTLFTAALLLVLLPKGGAAPGLVGLSLSYALALTSAQVFVTRWHCNLSNNIISVERIKQFMDVPSEPPAVVEDHRPASAWPSKGRIELQGLKIRYRPNAPLVLKGITCTIKEGSRVGVVGRTGSGKTTLISALFRLVEPKSGKILIDGLDICSIGLKDLRTNLSIIPQEPTLFKGSIRMNLDPLGLYSDNEIWEALEKCQLMTTISALPNRLDSSVSDEGENWSVGQRQLLCLGRVLLKRNRILVLDEATASIDSATDAILQRIIRGEFLECTVVTVAHRVPTVVDSDMVMVLSYGKVVEYDDPSKLMGTNSSFSKLVAEYWSSCTKNSCKNLNN